MCEIFFMVSTTGQNITASKVKQFLYTCLPSGNNNPDGWGAFWERSDKHGFVKGEEKFTQKHITRIMKHYRCSRFFVFHVRYATSKVCYENSHPFTTTDIRGCHNGVVRVPEQNGESDSFGMIQHIQNAHGSTVGEKICNGMPDVTGSYSVLLHALKESKLYYFRNSPSFGFMLDSQKGMIYGATHIEKLESLAPLVHGIFPNAIFARPDAKRVYSIDLSNGNFSEVCRIKEQKFVYKGIDGVD